MTESAGSSPPQWQLPRGATRGFWDYIHSPTIAHDYDAYFAYNELFAFDEQLIRELFDRQCLRQGRAADGQRPLVADLGCGTGRVLVSLARRGYRGLAVDLSQHMLDVVRAKAAAENLPIECLAANLVELEPIADRSVDFAVCMFSTLGMIRGRDNRRQCLAHVRRILRDDGLFVLHVHNLWFNLYDPGGPWWLLQNFWQSFWQRSLERGDKFFDYRGVPNMFLHVFSYREICRDLKSAGFHVRDSIWLHPRRDRAIRHPWCCGHLRANGWIIVCEY